MNPISSRTASVDVVGIRRDLHAHPELAFDERRTTRVIVEQLENLGLSPRVLPSGTGAVCDIGRADGPMIALRADIDALPLSDQKAVPYRSTIDGVCHGCGHDAHTAILLGAAAELVSRELPGRVRLVFQPAEEHLPGGAAVVMAEGALRDTQMIFAVHCDPRLQTGRMGVRVGAITAACDYLEVELTGPGGHTARPHLTVDLVDALGRLITELPSYLARRFDPRAGVTLVFGAVEAGRAPNAIPMTARLRGTLRVLDKNCWDLAEPLVRELVDLIVAPTGAKAEVTYVRGVPPVVNTAAAVAIQGAAVAAALGPDALAAAEQSMGGEDFAWYLEEIPGALARLGVRPPGAPGFDLHQGNFDIDEAALDVGVRYTVALAQEALARLAEPSGNSVADRPAGA
jgi:amidohydrolase